MHRPDITVITGPVSSGKTRALIRMLDEQSAERGSERVLALRPRFDTRDDEAALVSRTGLRFPAKRFGSLEELLDVAIDIDVLGVDEWHLLGAMGVSSNDVIQAFEVMPRTRLICCGLAMDFRARPFEAMGPALAMAHTVEVLTAKCARCAKEGARFSQRIVEGEERFVVGGSESYEPRCGWCFSPGL